MNASNDASTDVDTYMGLRENSKFNSSNLESGAIAISMTSSR